MSRRGGRFVELYVESMDLHKLAAQLKESQPELAKGLRKSLRKAGDEGKKSVQRATATWSKRIPGAVRVATTFGKSNAGVRIAVSARKAPHARPINNHGREGTFRHPVHADSDLTRDEWTWVSQRARPFIPDAIENSEGVERAMRDVLDDYAKKAGFR